MRYLLHISLCGLRCLYFRLIYMKHNTSFNKAPKEIQYTNTSFHIETDYQKADTFITLFFLFYEILCNMFSYLLLFHDSTALFQVAAPSNSTSWCSFRPFVTLAFLLYYGETDAVEALCQFYIGCFSQNCRYSSTNMHKQIKS